MSDKVKIREVTDKDLPIIEQNIKEAYLPLYREQNLSQETIDQMNLSQARLKERFTGNYFFVAEAEGKIVGMIGLKKDDGSDTHNRISMFYTLQDYRGKGIGSLLFNKIIYTAKKFNVKKIVVNSSLFAEKIYEHWGFKKVEIRTKKYPNGDTYQNVWMEKIIEKSR